MREEAEVEKRALVRFALFTALRERRVTPREVSIVLDSDGNNNNEDEVEVGKKVWICVGERNSECPDSDRFILRLNSDYSGMTRLVDNCDWLRLAGWVDALGDYFGGSTAFEREHFAQFDRIRGGEFGTDLPAVLERTAPSSHRISEDFFFGTSVI